MTYSTVKSVVIDAISNQGVKLDAKLEISEKAELSEDSMSKG